MISQDRLKSLLHYDHRTGIFTRIVQRGRNPAGSIAGTSHCKGYIQISLDYRLYLAHRLAFLFMTGTFPLLVDHKNGDRSDNRWVNLREASYAQNTRNRGPNKSNKCGFKGVDKIEHGRFKARIVIGGTTKHLGCFGSAEEAAIAYDEAARFYHADFAKTNF